MGVLAGENKSSSSDIGSILSDVTNEIQGAGIKKRASIIDTVADMGMSFLGKMFKK